MVRQDSYITSLESVVDEVVEWAVEYVNFALNIIAPDGRPFGLAKKTRKEELQEYVSQLRHNELAWTQWIEERALRIHDMLYNAGITEDKIASIHPYSIATAYAFAYSSKMEAMLQKEDEKVQERYSKELLGMMPSPSPDDDTEEEEEGDIDGEWGYAGTA